MPATEHVSTLFNVNDPLTDTVPVGVTAGTRTAAVLEVAVAARPFVLVAVTRQRIGLILLEKKLDGGE
jgi:hypothetical protein